MRDPYQVLGVPKTADEAAIKSAFRKLAKQFHPDQNKDNPKAKERFSEANAAYEILGDKEKRRQFDSGAIDAEGKERFQGFGGGGPSGTGGGMGGGGFSGAEDILSQMFGGMAGGGRAGMGGMGADPFAQMGGAPPRGARRAPPPKGED
ncbi:MAG: J domain-containing protein, partial [Pseudomonadota bacterium]